jgi:dTDP-4-dehydrorhamnose reductase
MLMLEKNYSGIIHLGGKERISRYAFGLLVKDIFNLVDSPISAIKQSEVKMAAPRPADVSMDSTKAFSIGYKTLSIKEELMKCFRNLNQN